MRIGSKVLMVGGVESSPHDRGCRLLRSDVLVVDLRDFSCRQLTPSRLGGAWDGLAAVEGAGMALVGTCVIICGGHSKHGTQQTVAVLELLCAPSEGHQGMEGGVLASGAASADPYEPLELTSVLCGADRWSSRLRGERDWATEQAAQ